jgi:hypothetical protein
MVPFSLPEMRNVVPVDTTYRDTTNKPEQTARER